MKIKNFFKGALQSLLIWVLAYLGAMILGFVLILAHIIPWDSVSWLDEIVKKFYFTVLFVGVFLITNFFLIWHLKKDLYFKIGMALMCLSIIWPIHDYFSAKNTYLKLYNTQPQSNLQNQAIQSEEGSTINSIVPQGGQKGTIVEIRGRNLSGFEGDLEVTFESTTGEKFVLYDNESYKTSGDSLIRVKVQEPCQKGEIVTGRYSGATSTCDFKPMMPGTYRVYAEPWGKRSNTVTFTLTQ